MLRKLFTLKFHVECTMKQKETPSQKVHILRVRIGKHVSPNMFYLNEMCKIWGENF